MPKDRDDDLDWLYGREQQQPEPEPTRVLPPGAFGAPPPGTFGTPPAGPANVQPAQPVYQPPSGAPAYGPPSVPPAQPAYGPPNVQSPPPIQPPPPVRPGPPAAPSGKPPRKRRPHRVRTIILLILAAFLAFLIAVPAYAWFSIDRVDDEPSGSRPPNQPGTTILLVGSDSREGLSKAEQKRLGTGSTAGQRTDTIMIVHIPPGGQPALISVPRDSYVPIPGHGSNKINAAYAFGGPQLLVQTVEQSTGLRIDAYVEIGFGGFVNVIDAVGGIKMCLPAAIKDKDSHLDLPKGCQNLTGIEALGYVRMRKADPLGDLGRVQRQRQMLAAVAKEAASPVTVINPWRYFHLTTATASSITIGTDTSFIEMVKFANAMRKIAAGSGLTLTVPVGNPGAWTPAGSAVLWDSAKAKEMFAEIARGDTSDLKRFAK